MWYSGLLKTADEKYQGWANWETWNLDLWASNDEGIYNEIAANKPYDLEKAEAMARSIFPDGTEDMDPGDMDKVVWDEIAESWNEFVGSEDVEDEVSKSDLPEDMDIDGWLDSLNI